MNVMALLPYMVQNYEDANETCIISAENIAQVKMLPTNKYCRYFMSAIFQHN